MLRRENNPRKSSEELVGSDAPCGGGGGRRASGPLPRWPEGPELQPGKVPGHQAAPWLLWDLSLHYI